MSKTTRDRLEDVQTELYKILGAIRLAERAEPDGIDEIRDFTAYTRNCLELIENALESQIETLESIYKGEDVA